MKRFMMSWLFVTVMAGFAAQAGELSGAVRAKIIFSQDQTVQFVPAPVPGSGAGSGRGNALISANCQGHARGEWSCDAYQALAKSSLKGLEHLQRNPDINLGASICVSKLAGKLVVGRDAADKDRSFCKFPDGSLIENAALLKSAERSIASTTLGST